MLAVFVWDGRVVGVGLSRARIPNVEAKAGMETMLGN